MSDLRAFGVDGCKGGWMVASGSSILEAPVLTVVPTFREVVAGVLASSGTACVDIPIGLSAGARRCDGEARRMLGAARASSVFTPPCRGALAGSTDAEIRRLNIQATGRSLSAQALGIIPKIREVDRAMTPALQARIREVHPEVIFAARAPERRGLAAPKKSPEGRRARLALLPAAWATAAEACLFLRSIATADDVVDSLAALMVALDLAGGLERRLPSEVDERDEAGLRMEMLY